jgi:ribonuclease HI
MKTIYIYSDASFSKPSGTGIIGFACIAGEDTHLKTFLTTDDIQIEKIKETNNIRCEIKSAIHAIESRKQSDRVILFTDCESIVNLPTRRQKLEKMQFKNKRGQILKNADLYVKFFSLMDKFHIEIRWIKGHTPEAGQDHIHKNFSVVDQAVRKKLREITNA